MFKCINGWTKKKILKVLKARRFEKAAYDENFKACQYRTNNGNKCAVGMFIPKNHKGFEVTGPVTYLLSEYPDLEKILPLNRTGMSALQFVHDDEENRKCAKTKMIEWISKNVKD